MDGLRIGSAGAVGEAGHVEDEGLDTCRMAGGAWNGLCEVRSVRARNGQAGAANHGRVRDVD